MSASLSFDLEALQLRPIHLSWIWTKVHTVPFEVAVKRRRVQVVPHVHGGDGDIQTVGSMLSIERYVAVYLAVVRLDNFSFIISASSYPEA